jgi:hypothetical protein
MKKLISILLSICILILAPGCQSAKLLSMEEASAMSTDKKYIVLHTPKWTYKLYNYKFTDESIEGDLMKFTGKNTYAINVYTIFLLDFKLDNEESQFVKVPRSVIEKITYAKDSPEKTALAVLGGIGVVILIGVIAAHNITIDGGL